MEVSGALAKATAVSTNDFSSSGLIAYSIGLLGEKDFIAIMAPAANELGFVIGGRRNGP
jgi:hypothetical protein